MKFIGTRVDKDCYEAENVLRQSCVKYEYIDISSSTENLQMFLDLRDHRPEFQEIRQKGYPGIPCFVMDDGSILFDENRFIYDEEEKEEKEEEEALTV